MVASCWLFLYEVVRVLETEMFPRLRLKVRWVRWERSCPRKVMFYFEHGRMDEANDVKSLQRTLPTYTATYFANSHKI
jgi:hypothetical protein